MIKTEQELNKKLNAKVQNFEKLSTPVDKTQRETTESVPKLETEQPEARPVDPTRFGDWEKNGRCIDF